MRDLEMQIIELRGQVYSKVVQGRLMLVFGIMIGCVLTQLFI